MLQIVLGVIAAIRAKSWAPIILIILVFLFGLWVGANGILFLVGFVVLLDWALIGFFIWIIVDPTVVNARALDNTA